MKVLVTGGAGFIGSHIVDLLIEEGHTVAVVDNLVTGDKDNVNLKAAFYKVDILHSDFDKVVEAEAPEVIIHHAALVYVQQSIENPIADGKVNAIGTLNVLQSAHIHNVRKIIYSSTCAVYGEAQLIATKEEHEISPMSFYGASKYMAEIYVRLFYELYKLDYTIFRYANVYGPRQKYHGEGGVVPIFTEKMKKGISPTIFGDGNQTRDFVYVKDVAKANLLAINRGSHKTLNIGTGTGTTINDLYNNLDEIIKANLTVNYRPERLGDVKNIRLDTSKAEKELGWRARYTLRKGLIETIASYENK